MPICTCGRTVIFFSHIPKTGGSSIEAYLSEKGKLTLLGEPKIDGVHRQHLTRDQLATLPDLPAFDHSFAVIRDPVSRLASEFIWRSEPLKPLQRLARPTAARRARRIMMAGGKRSLTFREWVPLVLDEARQSPGMRDNHMRPQVEFLAGGDRLFSFEAGLQPVFRWIDRITDGMVGAPTCLKKASSAKPEIDSTSRELIESFYAEDVALHREIRAGRTML